MAKAGGKGTSHSLMVRIQMRGPLLSPVYQFVRHTDTAFPLDPAIALLGIYTDDLEKLIHTLKPVHVCLWLLHS